MDQVSPAPPHEGLLWSPSNVKDHQLTKLRELINAKHDLVLSGSMDDVCVYSLGNKCAQLTCWNRTEATALTWIDNDSFIVGEASGMITIDKAYQNCFRKVCKCIYYNIVQGDQMELMKMLKGFLKMPIY